MPVYEYECNSCGGRFEVTRKFSDPAVSACSLCDSAEIRKLLSSTSFVLKGSGWYATDYASSVRKKAEQSEKPCADAKPAAAGCSSAACAAGACAAKE